MQEAAALGLNAEVPSADEIAFAGRRFGFRRTEHRFWRGDGNRAEFADVSHSGRPGFAGASSREPAAYPVSAPPSTFVPNFSLPDLHEAIELVRQLDPPGVGCRDLRECLLYQLRFHQQQLESQKNGNGEREAQPC